jgi:Asp-tRNA(Asn)/Glu-tRNA(Gln) amidotransferase A subunit family amidase
MDATDLGFTSANELAQLIRRRSLSPVEITRTVLERIERLNPHWARTSWSTPSELSTKPARPNRR